MKGSTVLIVAGVGLGGLILYRTLVPAQPTSALPGVLSGLGGLFNGLGSGLGKLFGSGSGSSSGTSTNPLAGTLLDSSTWTSGTGGVWGDDGSTSTGPITDPNQIARVNPNAIDLSRSAYGARVPARNSLSLSQ